MPVHEIGGKLFATFGDQHARAEVKEVAARVATALRTGDDSSAVRALEEVPEFGELGIHDAVLGRADLYRVPWTPTPATPTHASGGWTGSHAGYFNMLPELAEELSARGAVVRDAAISGRDGVAKLGSKMPTGLATLFLRNSGARGAEELLGRNVTLVNPVTEIVQNKSAMSEMWKMAGVSQPETITRIGGPDDRSLYRSVARAYEQLGPDVVIKKPRGARGEQVFEAHNEREAVRRVRSLQAFDEPLDWPLMQRMANISNADTRVHYGRDWKTGDLLPIGAVERASLGDNFKTNLSAGGAVRPILDLSGNDSALSSAAIHEGARAGDAMGLDWFSADIATDATSGRPILFEVDTLPMPLESHFPVAREHQTFNHLVNMLLHSNNETLASKRGALAFPHSKQIPQRYTSG